MKRERRRTCPSGKRPHATYGDALAALIRLESGGLLRGPFGSAYQCPSCDGWHVSSRKFTLAKKRGRGKARRKVLERVS